MATDTATDPCPIPAALDRLASLLEQREHALAAAEGDGALAASAVDAAKDIFDLGESRASSPTPSMHQLTSFSPLA